MTSSCKRADQNKACPCETTACAAAWYNHVFGCVCLFSAIVIAAICGQQIYERCARYGQWGQWGRESTNNWFRSSLNHSAPLYVQSHWGYYTPKEWVGFVMHSVAALDPPLKKGDSVFDIGCGVGAALKTLDDEYSLSRVGGLDIVPEAVKEAKEVFHSMKDNFFVGDAAADSAWEQLPKVSYDHVIAIGSLLYMLNLEDAERFVRRALALTRPGGSLAFTVLLEPGRCCQRSANIAIPISWWQEMAEKLDMTIVAVQQMSKWDGSVVGMHTDAYGKTQDERYAIFLRKGAHVKALRRSKKFAYDTGRGALQLGQ